MSFINARTAERSSGRARPQAAVFKFEIRTADGHPVAFCKAPVWVEPENLLAAGTRKLALARGAADRYARRGHVAGPTHADGTPACALEVRYGSYDGRDVVYAEASSDAASSSDVAATRDERYDDGARDNDDDDEDDSARAWRRASKSIGEKSNDVGKMMDIRRKTTRAVSRENALESLLAEHVMHILTDEECSLLWDKREDLAKVPRALPKFLLTVNWGAHADVREGYRLLKTWAPMPPLEALQLLSLRFPDPKVRAYPAPAPVSGCVAAIVSFDESAANPRRRRRIVLRRTARRYAVRCMNALPDAELAAVMLQLAQVVKFERSHDTALNRFLLRRALRNPSVCGHALYWSLATEKDVNDEHHCCRVLFDLYNRCCGDYRVKLGHQVLLVTKLAQITETVKRMRGASDADRDAVLRRELEGVVLPRAFQLPLSPFMVCRGLNLEKCKVMGSAQKPLWLTFHNAVRDGRAEILSVDVATYFKRTTHAVQRCTNEQQRCSRGRARVGPQVRDAPPHVVIFKCGDDLRQDQLTLQVLRSMDALWAEAGLELRMSPYRNPASESPLGRIRVGRRRDRPRRNMSHASPQRRRRDRAPDTARFG